MKIIHTVGDSHAWSKFAWGKVNLEGYSVVCNHIGPRLMYNVTCDEIMNVVDTKNCYKVVLCFGEIDCRVHVHKQVSRKRLSYTHIIDDIVCRYKIQLSKLPQEFIKKIIIFNVVPPGLWAITGKQDNKYRPTTGLATRVLYHKYMNKRLLHMCNELNIVFFDIYKNIEVLPAGNIDTKLVDKAFGNIHLNDPTPVEKYIKLNNI